MEYGRGRADVGVSPVRRLTTETKNAFRTTEFWVFALLLIGILIAGTVNDSEGSEFGADDVWLYATLLGIGYMISRGLAKSGVRDPYWDDPSARTAAGDDSLTDRVKSAAQVLRDGEPTQPTTPSAGVRSDQP